MILRKSWISLRQIRLALFVAHQINRLSLNSGRCFLALIICVVSPAQSIAATFELDFRRRQTRVMIFMLGPFDFREEISYFFFQP